MGKLKKYGEIGRFKINGLTYIVEAQKEWNHPVKGVLFVTSIVFWITLKTAKRARRKNLSKWEYQFKLLNNTNNFEVITKLILIVENYIRNTNPFYIQFLIIKDGDQEKRSKFYCNFLNRFGYVQTHISNDMGCLQYLYEKKKEAPIWKEFV